jgi:ketosteroid isomerase-like protein
MVDFREEPVMRTVCVSGVMGLIALGSATALAFAGRQPATAPQAVEDLLAADRAFSKASARKDGVSGLSAMFAEDVVMPVPGGQFARGASAAADALRADSDNATGRVVWTPVRGGVSADGQHGFTFGYLTLTRSDGTAVPLKYLAYWIRRPEGWRVVAYKRGRATEAPASTAMMAPAVPGRTEAASNDAAAIERFRQSLDAAERAFSDEAQKIGIGPAFAKFGSADAVNMGPPTSPGFIVGAEAIGRLVGSAYPPGQPGVSWAPDSVIVASSGDLGVTIGMIRPNGPGPDGKVRPASPFFTIWRRANPSQPWRYIAE